VGVTASRPSEHVVVRGTPGYPPGLEALADPPERLYVRGGPVPGVSTCIALVGARAASAYGVAVAHRLAGDLARVGFTIVSGLARGIDAAAHDGALAAGGRTIAVVPGSLAVITPPHHTALAGAIARSGAVVSEVEHGGPFGKGAFVTRNRLIAALSAATVVVEAAARSGALTTAEAARRLGRPVLAVPGDIDRDTARGCHALLRSGARLCEGAADVVAAIGASVRPAGDTRAGDLAPHEMRAVPPEGRLHAALDDTPRLVDDLARAAGLGASEALAALAALEWSGLARSRPGQRWVRGR
jgi:DNA processing protein